MKGTEKLVFTDDAIYIESTMDKGEAIMHVGERGLMNKLADVTTQNGGDILEIGFGLHLSADRVQSNPNVTSHTIIEVHPEIYKRAVEWSKDKPNTEIIFGDWINVIPTITKKFDGILHDTHRDGNISIFLDVISSKCNEDCIVGFFHYDKIDERFGTVEFKLDENDLSSLPYGNLGEFKNEVYKIKYTKFNGLGFHHEGGLNKSLI